MIVIDSKHKIGAVVYLLTDLDNTPRVVTGILVRSGNYVTYELSCLDQVSYHVDTEIMTVPNYKTS